MKKYIAGGVILVAIAAFLVFTSRTTGPSQVATTVPTDAIPTKPSPSGSSATTSASSGGSLKDGTYTGTEFGAVYGPLQVAAVITGGELTDVKLLEYPNDPGETTQVNQNALPKLVQEAIAAQSAQVDVVSGATQTSQAFQESLGTALALAR